MPSKKAYFTKGNENIWFIGLDGSIYSISDSEEKKQVIPSLPWTNATCIYFQKQKDCVIIGYEDEFTRVWSMYDNIIYFYSIHFVIR